VPIIARASVNTACNSTGFPPLPLPLLYPCPSPRTGWRHVGPLEETRLILDACGQHGLRGNVCSWGHRNVLEGMRHGRRDDHRRRWQHRLQHVCARERVGGVAKAGNEQEARRPESQAKTLGAG